MVKTTFDLQMARDEREDNPEPGAGARPTPEDYLFAARLDHAVIQGERAAGLADAAMHSALAAFDEARIAAQEAKTHRDRLVSIREKFNDEWRARWTFPPAKKTQA